MRKSIGLAVLALAVALSGGVEAQKPVAVQVFKDASCGCCANWVEHLRRKGFAPTSENVADMNAVKAKYGVPAQTRSCHTALVGGYVIEGHVPAADIQRLLKEKPKVAGLAKTIEEKGDSKIWRFVVENVAPLEPEPSMPPLSETLGHVHVSTYKSWDDMGRWYWGFVKDQFTADDEVRRRALEITKGATDEKAKVRAIYDFVVQKTRYVALEFGNVAKIVESEWVVRVEQVGLVEQPLGFTVVVARNGFDAIAVQILNGG